MGEVRVKMRCENLKDRVLSERDPSCAVRAMDVDALVDTGAVMTLLPQDLVEALGLELSGKVIVTLADDSKVELPKARMLTLTVCDRQMDTNCLVGPPQSEPLVGQIVLEQLDLIVDALRGKVTSRPESPFLPSLKMK